MSKTKKKSFVVDHGNLNLLKKIEVTETQKPKQKKKKQLSANEHMPPILIQEKEKEKVIIELKEKEKEICETLNITKDNSTQDNSIQDNSIQKQEEDTSENWDSFLSELNNLNDFPEIPNSYVNVDYNIQDLNNWNFNEQEQIKNVRVDNNICTTCNIKLIIIGSSYVCDKCGFESEKDTYSEITSVATNYNVNNNGFVSIRFTGKGSYNNQRSLYKTSADYSKYRKVNTLKDMNNWNNLSEKYHIPKNVIVEANEMFAQIKEKGYVFRKDGKRGVLSACLYYACYNNGISKTPTEIAQFSLIEEKFQSQGDRILHDLNEKGIINIPTKINPIFDYINRYFEILNIDAKYKPFIIDLIKRADDKNIHLLHDNKTNTKAIGSIYILIDRTDYKKTITKEKIEKECGISKTTFIRYCDIIYNYYKLFKRVFKKHKIPMPIEWKKKE